MIDLWNFVAATGAIAIGSCIGVTAAFMVLQTWEKFRG